MRIINFGSINLDFVYQVEHFAQPGETIKALSFERFAGGKGFNQSIALARAGSPPIHIGQVGGDGLGLVGQLKDEGVDVNLIEVGDTPTGHAIIQVDASGENSIIVYGGANLELSPSRLEQACSTLGEDDWVLIQNEINGLEQIIQLASDRGSQIIFNPSPMQEALLELPLERVNTFLINRSEGEALSGESTPDRIIQVLRLRFPEATLVLTLGPQGVLYSNEREQLQVNAHPVDTVDTTGAGDTFAGYFLASLCQGAAPEEALQRACRAAALCVSRPGAAASIPNQGEI